MQKVFEMLLDLKGFFTNEAEKKEKRFSFSFSMDDVGIDGTNPFVSPIEASGTAETENGAVRLKAEVSYEFKAECNRCLAEIHEWKTERYEHLLLLSEDDVPDDTYVRVTEEAIELSELLREDIILNLPTVLLCREDCKGLCPKCGQNLNDGPCGCKEDSVDPRLEILKTLIRQED